MNKTNLMVVACTLMCILTGCKTLDTVIDNLTDVGGPVRGNKFEKGEMSYEVNYCTLLPSREFECDVTISNYNQDKSMHIGSVDIRDDHGKEYRATINPAYGMRQYYPGERFTHKILANNVSTQATSVSAVVVGIDVRGGRANSFREVFILHDIPMRAAASQSAPTPQNTASAQEVDAVTDQTNQDSAGNNQFEKGEMKYKVNYCTLLPSREFECDVTISNYNQDKSMHIGSVDIRDDHGKEYRATTNPAYGMREYHPGERFTHKVVASNISTQATAVSAVVVGIDMRGGRANSFREAFLLHGIPMRAPTPPTEAKPGNNAPAQELDEEDLVGVSAGSTDGLPGPRMDSPTAARLPESSAAETRPVIATQSKKAAASPNLLVGCWKWSNGMRIEVQEGGSANNGFALGSWEVKGNKRYSVTWPDFTGNVSLSADGQSLSSIDAIGTSSTAARLQGDPASFVGSWRWDNGGIVTIAADGAMSAGPLKGSWSGSGRNYSTAWPIVDVISVLADGKELSGQNQFGSFTATKMPGC